MIYEMLSEANKDVFPRYHIQLNLLKNCPQVIPTLASWLYETWHPYDASVTRENFIQSFETRLNSDKIPITFIALKEMVPVGMISLKKQTSPEFSDFPENRIWMSGLHVIPEERNRGLGQDLLKFAANTARSLGYKELYFFTSDLSKVQWYTKREAQILEERPFRNHTIVILYIPL